MATNPLEFDERFIIGEVRGTWLSGRPRAFPEPGLPSSGKRRFNETCKEEGKRWGYGLSEPTLQPLS